MDQLIRSFLALDLSDSLKKEAQSFINQMKPEFPEFRFIPSDNWHLTLHFFGKISTEDIERLKIKLPEFFKGIKPFSIRLQNLGAFPNERKPELLWLGVSETSEIIKLKNQLGLGLKNLNFETERRAFHPHITVARLKNGAKKPNSHAFKSFKTETMDEINHLTFYQSELTSSGAVYAILYTFPFSTP